MKKYIYIAACIILLGASIACEKTIDVDVPFEEPKLVVNGYLNPDSNFSVQVSKSKFILDQAELRRLEDAQLSLFEGDRQIGELQHVKEGYYELAGVKPALGKSYTLKVKHAGLDPVQVTEKTPAFMMPVQVKATKQEQQDEYYGTQYRLSFSMNDPAGEENYYLLRAMEKRIAKHYDQNGELVEEYIYWNSMNLESPDPRLEVSCVNSYYCDFLLQDNYFNGKAYEVNMTASSHSYGGNEEVEIYLGFYTVSKAAYLYFKTAHQANLAGGDPFAEPVRVYTNVEGGYGIWAAISGSITKAEF